MTEREREQRFDALQRTAARGLGRDASELAGESIVVVPSVTLDRVVDRRAPVQAYEERFLFLLLLLRQPRLQLIYVTSTEIDPDHHRVLPRAAARRHPESCPGTAAPGRRARRFAEPADREAARAPATDRADPRAHPRSGRSRHLVPYNVTSLERDLALALGIPLYGADPRLLPLGTKTGCRRLFAEEGVPHPLGYEDVDGLDALLAAVARLRAERPRVEEAIVKLNEGVSGTGNAVVDLRGLPEPGSAGEHAELEGRVRGMAFELAEMSFEQYLAKLEERRGSSRSESAASSCAARASSCA